LKPQATTKHEKSYNLGKFDADCYKIREFAETYTIIGTRLGPLQNAGLEIGLFTSDKACLRIPP